MAARPPLALLLLLALPLLPLLPLLLASAATAADSGFGWEKHHIAKLRHSRHSIRDTYPPSYQTSPRLAIKDNNKPVFAECSRYHPTMDEELEPDIVVLTVHAEDKDPPENGGNLTYQFVSTNGEENKFRINSTTGEIRTFHKFDRDEPNREKEVYVTVRVTDNGIPPLDDVCTIKIVINDINDNAPIFDKVSYTESIPQDLLIGREAMRISATDIDDGNNSIVEYSLSEFSEDIDYFRIDKNSGVIFLTKTIDKSPGYQFNLKAEVTDKGKPPKENAITLDIRVIESNKKSPAFISAPDKPIFLKENISDYQLKIATLEAVSNIPNEDELIFELVEGKTEQTNKKRTFILDQMKSDGQTAYITLGRPLDYERITEYTLTVRVQNKYNLAAETTVQIEVEDVNDNIPLFTEVTSGSVLENEPIGTPVMQVRAIDLDGTPAHNQVTYEIDQQFDPKLFSIDPQTGNITTMAEFDRENKDFYNVKIIVTDNSPSALYTDNRNNSGQQVFRIEIADKNDNPPRFTKSMYVAEGISEAANVNEIVTEVKAIDNDTASQLQFSIVAGNTYDAFFIEETTGKIRVKNQLDYENITEYTLSVRAFDGYYEDNARVKINIENINDNPPVFLQNYTKTIQEELLIEGCIVTVEAFDPDIPDKSSPQKIVYSLVKEDQRSFLTINNSGCLSLVKPLDRDPPTGYSKWQVIVQAQDENGSPTSLRSTTEVIIILEDINDNAPFLTNPQPVVWYENQDPGLITVLTANDHDSEENGPPFEFSFDVSASMDIKSKFALAGDKNEQLMAKVTFDREEQKEYWLPIAITDSGLKPMTGISYLHVVIGDRNDNKMQEGHSDIFVYNYKGEAPDTEIGRIYVDDPDDWDLPDKQFYWLSFEDKLQHFDVDRNSGMITMREATPSGTYSLKFNVTEVNEPMIPFHWVQATVNVTIKDIPEEAVDKSGSIRFINATAEDFIKVQYGGLSKKDILQQQLSSILNTSLENIDIITVYNNKPINESFLDVRFSGHGSPYYSPEKINFRVSENIKELEQLLGQKIQMVNIDECLVEKIHCEDSCRNRLDKSNVPLSVYTNKTSFVGVSAKVEPECSCNVKEPITCFNGGTPFSDRCECPPGLTGPRCEITSVSFHGDGWAMYPSFSACNETKLSLSIIPAKENGLIFYAGPVVKNHHLVIQDFVSLELVNGYVVLLVDYGSGTSKVEHKHNQIGDNQPHFIDITFSRTGIEMFVDGCRKSNCMYLAAPKSPNEFLNINGPLQIGGASVNLQKLGQEFGWSQVPSGNGFVGCISNFTINSETYNLGLPSLSKNMEVGCQTSMARAVSFGIDMSFLVVILICIAILALLLLAVVVHRKKSEGWAEKEFDDIRENIINYEDEGGGEGDAAYDLHVLRNYDPPDKEHEKLQMLSPTMADTSPNISVFLNEKKSGIDRDPDTNPFDDVRHYAYEGDGNTTGSLSSLASCTDEGDLKFNYLSSFGPRFRKLADMYGEVPSDEDESQAPGEESWC